ncbi:MAG: hypothetical protein IJP89_00755 [Synergistaceae bacterium]|nr:hypothetical protein [Synergistaceae bacterium]MBR0258499.1 hypothetical protein [Synergistaceae bacterium]
MSSAVLEETEYTDDIDYDYELETWGDDYRSPKFRAVMDEILAEENDMAEHPEKYKVYDSFKDMLADMGLDVDGLPDD